MARKTKLNSETQDRILKAISLGLTYKDAAQFAGIGETTFYEWKKKGENASAGKFREFWEALKKAEVEGENVLLQRINDAATGKNSKKKTKTIYDKEGKAIGKVEIIEEGGIWQAAAWILERRFPERWGRNARRDDNQGKDRFDKWMDALEEAAQDFEGRQLH